MASYYGEILPLSSRAVDDDEDTNVPIDELELVISKEADPSANEPEFLFFGVGPSACIFLEAYVLDLTDTGINADSLELLQVKKQLSETLISELPLSGLDYRRQEDVLARMFRSTSNPKTLVCLCPGQLSPEYAALATNMIIGSTICATIKVVLAITSAHITEFKHSNPVDNLSAPFLRHLSTSSLPEDPILESISRWLEQPNVMSGVTAAAMTESEVRGIAGLASVCYVDTNDSSTARAFCPLLKVWPLNAVARVTESAERSIDKLMLQRLKCHGNLYI